MSQEYDEELRRLERKSRRNPKAARQAAAERQPGMARQSSSGRAGRSGKLSAERKGQCQEEKAPQNHRYDHSGMFCSDIYFRLRLRDPAYESGEAPGD